MATTTAPVTPRSMEEEEEVSSNPCPCADTCVDVEDSCVGGDVEDRYAPYHVLNEPRPKKQPKPHLNDSLFADDDDDDGDDDTESLSLSATEEGEDYSNSNNNHDLISSLRREQSDQLNPQYRPSLPSHVVTTHSSSALVEMSPLGKTVRFSLDRNQFYDSESLSPRGRQVQRTKRVRFSVEMSLVYYDVVERTEQEIDKCWHDNDAMEHFRERFEQEARQLFLIPTTPTEDEQVGGSPRSSFLSFFRSNNKDITTLCPNDVNEDPELNAVGYVILDALEMCQQAKTEEAMKHIGAMVRDEDLLAIYSGAGVTRNPEQQSVLGLEHFVVTPIRGDPAGLRAFILQQAEFITQRETCPDKKADLVAHISSCVSRPSRILAFELAKAHQASLREEYLA